MTHACAESLSRERLRIPGPAGALSAELVYPSSDPASHLVVILNPHPLMGGTMQNNLVAALATHLAGEPGDACGASGPSAAATLRFDYRGVGESEGERADVESSMAQFWQSGTAPQDDGLIADASAVLRWAGRSIGLPTAMVGYSFGAYAAVRALAERGGGVNDAPLAGPLVLISPTLRQHPFAALELLRLPLLVIYSDDDFATPRDVTERWLAALPFPPQSLCVEGGQHFFKGREPRVAGACAAFVRSILAAGAMA